MNSLLELKSMLPDCEDFDFSGKSLENYHFNCEIGHGAFGKVYSAFDKKTGIKYAIKKITHLEFGTIELAREITILKQMNNEQILQIREVIPILFGVKKTWLKNIDKIYLGVINEVDGRRTKEEILRCLDDPSELKNLCESESIIIYLVLEWVDTDLMKLIQSPLYLSSEQVKQIMYQILLGLKYIHSANIIHRDLKPNNILINDNGSIKICDFGLARSLNGVRDWDEEIRKRAQDDLECQKEEEIPTMTKSSSTDEIKTQTSSKVNSRKRKGSDDKKKCELICEEIEHKQRISRFLKRTQEDRDKEERVLSPHVVTRFYRPPEVILMDKHYGKKVDVWSAGAIFCELLQMKKENVPSYYCEIKIIIHFIILFKINILEHNLK